MLHSIWKSYARSLRRAPSYVNWFMNQVPQIAWAMTRAPNKVLTQGYQKASKYPVGNRQMEKTPILKYIISSNTSLFHYFLFVFLAHEK